MFKFIRFFDVTFSIIGIFLLLPLFILLLIFGFLDTGNPLFCQERMGRNKSSFKLIKFRSMHKNTSSVATHLVSISSITPYGSFLRRSKLDELPQLWNVLVGDMSLVGPRPNLFNQLELEKFRDALDVYSVRPGITGLAQMNKIDMSCPRRLAYVDSKMIRSLSIYNYFNFIILTILGKGNGDGVTAA